jgi:hypothetical protein
MGIKGNPVKIRNSTRCCIAQKNLKLHATVHSEWEGFSKRAKSENLPRSCYFMLSGGKGRNELAIDLFCFRGIEFIIDTSIP